MKSLLLAFSCILLFNNPSLAAKDEHGHDESKSIVDDPKDSHADHDESKVPAGEKHDDHEESEKHDDHKDGEVGEEHADHKDEHGEEEEGSSAVGPDKGILAKSEEGFKLAPEALKTFEIKTEVIRSNTSEISRKSLVEIKNDKFIYRIRNSWIKKIPVTVLKKSRDLVTVQLSQFQAGDLIITNGVGFVRTAELVAEEGMASGHSH